MMAHSLASHAPRLGDLPALPALVPGLGAMPLADITADSRRVIQGSLFCARAGLTRHGMDHASQAIAQGAAAILWEPGGDWNETRIQAFAKGQPCPFIQVDGLSARLGEIAAAFFGQPSAAMTVTGITGTNGKSSCAWFMAQLNGDPCAMIGTLGAGFPRDLQEASHTTPEPVELQRLLASLRDEGAKAIAMEVSSHALDQDRVAGTVFDTGIFTNLTRDHLDYHGDMAAYGEAKARLFRWPQLKRAVINLDDPFGVKLARELGDSLEVIGFSMADGDSPAPGVMDSITPRIFARACRADGLGLSFQLDGDWGAMPIRVPLLGRFNIANLLAAYGVLLSQGASLEELARRTESLESVPGRMQLLGGGNRPDRRHRPDRPTVVVDYAHTPDALEQALTSLREHASGRLHCLFGCGGERDPGKRPLMGAVAERLADRLVISDDNPRREPGEAIIEEILGGLQEPGKARIERARARAIDTIIAEAKPGDLVLIAGKGHERYQQIGDLRHPFDDVAEAQTALDRHFRGEA
jgi:UDP-N-acetylmuramoyl-L-alanyl-D-glutamate--2,6-diaminopimelate ligase